MHTLLFRLAGPMQSWGTYSRFSVRDSGLEPSKSGVIGLICAALGRPRQEPVEDLATLRMGVRVDQEGRLYRDYHIAQKVLKAGGGIKPTEPSARYFLADANFLVGLESGDLSRLETIQSGLRNPVWNLFLGRKSFVPSQTIWLEDGLLENTRLDEALQTYQPVTGWRRLIIEAKDGETIRMDQPISYAERTFQPRRVKVYHLSFSPDQTEAA